MYASFNGQPEVVETLVRAGAEIDRKDEASRTALILAAKEGHAETALLLVGLNADVTVRDKEGYTASDWTERNGNLDLARSINTR